MRASSVAFATIVFSQVGVLLTCRSEWRSVWRTLRDPNPLLWFGIASELLLLSALVLVPALGELFTMAPFPVQALGWMALAPLLIIVADDARKRWLHGGLSHADGPAGPSPRAAG